jgi:glycosyltransferase involved in cell wall biosynthesis
MLSMASRIRVMHVALQLDTGGMERLLAEFARHADRDRFELRFLSLGARGRVADDIESHGWSVDAFQAGPGLRPLIVARLARLFRDWRVDVVHAHNTKPLFYVVPAAKLARTGTVVYTRHGRRTGSTPRQDLLFRLAARRVDRVVCVSNDGRELCERDGIDPRAIQTLPNGIDLERFPYAGPCADAPAVFVGRLCPEKDVATLLAALPAVIARRPQFRLRIAGAGPCAAELKRLAAALNVDRHVSFLGEVADIPALLRDSSVFVLPSLTEGMPLTVLEAMASGLPVVATDVGGIPEAVADGVSGFLVPPRNPAALASALLRASGSASIVRRLGLAGRERAERLFNVRSMVSRYETVYHQALTRKDAQAA